MQRWKTTTRQWASSYVYMTYNNLTNLSTSTGRGKYTQNPVAYRGITSLLNQHLILSI
jgi:hypothetical protein